MPEFLRPGCELTLAELAGLTNADLQSAASSGRRVRDIASLDAAGPGDISFLDHEKRLGELAQTRAEACFLPQRFAASAPPDLAVLLTEEPYRAFVIAARALFPDALRVTSPFETAGRAGSALIHPSARLEAGVTVDPLAIIGPRAEIGAGTLIAAGAVIGADVRIGRQCAIGAGASISHALIGDRVVIRPGARIGVDGSGYLPGPRAQLKIPQPRRVIIQDDAEVGANATVDRGSAADTVIGEGSKIDNLVQIAHNVRIGRHCLVASRPADGATLEDYVVLGPGGGSIA